MFRSPAFVYPHSHEVRLRFRQMLQVLQIDHEDFQRSFFLFTVLLAPSAALDAQTPVGTHGLVGCLKNPTTVSRLEITKPGVYENQLIDAQGRGGNIVKITADGVTLRNCEIHNGSGNAIGVFGTKVVIENCRIHHMLNGTFKDQKDAHGITGRWGDVTIRNCDISHVSGDCVQFDPDRASQGSRRDRGLPSLDRTADRRCRRLQSR